jgi:glycosyltransferase involved in cell wall biosynthesis
MIMHAKVGEDLRDVTAPIISVVTPSLNHARFLRQTIESVASQTFRSFEHIVVDGGSTDGTVEILKEFPHLRWVSERDEHVVEAYQKAFAMARGRYIIQCCVSDGFLDPGWFRKCVEVLEKDDEVSLVWGFAQTMSEDGDLLNVSFQEFFADPPPQKQDFLAFWLASGFPLTEGNYCVRSSVIKSWFPDKNSEGWFRTCVHPGFTYNLMTQGYVPYFIPVVANFGRQHHDQRSQRLQNVEGPALKTYLRQTKKYACQVLRGEVVHVFRNGRGEIMRTLESKDLGRLRRQIWRHKLLRSYLLRRDLYTMAKELNRRFRRRWSG